MVATTPTGRTAPFPSSCHSKTRSSSRARNSESPRNSRVPSSSRKAGIQDDAATARENHTENTAQTSRPYGLSEAPTFRPTEEEFKDPFQYIKTIEPLGRKYGICKVIPPESWASPFAIDKERFRFKTRKQELNSVDGGTRANLNYLDQLSKFHKQNGQSFNRFPSVDKRPLDLYKLRRAVEARGGFDKVCKFKKWAEIGRDLGYSGKIMSSLSTSLKNSYHRWLYPYEQYLRAAKPGVYHQLQLEVEQTGSTQSSPRSPFKHARANDLEGSPTPVSRTETLSELHPSAAPSVKASPAPSDETATSKFLSTGERTPGRRTPARAGLLTVNSNPNLMNTLPIEKHETDGCTSREISPSLTDVIMDNKGLSSSYSSLSKENRNTHNKRSYNQEATPKSDPDISVERRSKRLKSVTATPVTPLQNSPAADATRQGGRGPRCDACGKSDSRKRIIICDSCDLEYHIQCIDPPLDSIPEYDWHCPKCLVGTGEFGFEEGSVYSLRQFQAKADRFKRDYFSRRMPLSPDKAPISETEGDVEREFWRLAESLTETVEVEYGADIHSTIHGSGFPTFEKHPLEPYSTHPWNLNILPLFGDSLFRHIKSDVSGMTVPWVYVGMCFSTFCWHNEDHFTYSANYQHVGETKTWYGVSGDDSEAFEDAMRQAVPELFETQPDLLFQLVTLLPPGRLKKAGVDVYALDQHAGEFIITFPKAYHAGFNQGFNVNEAVNFAPAEWEPYGEEGTLRLQRFRRQPCFSHDDMLLTASMRDHTIETAKWLAPALQRMAKRELEQRAVFAARRQILAVSSSYSPTEEDLELAVRPVIDVADLPEEQSVCAYCRTFAHLSRFRCDKQDQVMCLLHAENCKCCDEEDAYQRLLGPNHTLIYRYTDEELRDIVESVVTRASIPQRWSDKLNSMMVNDPTPSLKTLHSLLSEGEKIPYKVPGLDDLSTYVTRCDQWVSEATNYLTRKQQNRRKSERSWRKAVPKMTQAEDHDKIESRGIEGMHQLLDDAKILSFHCPQIDQLRDKLKEIEQFQRDAHEVLREPTAKSSATVEEVIERGNSFGIDLPEIESLGKIMLQVKWNDSARQRRTEYHSYVENQTFISEGEKLGIPPTNENLLYFRELQCRGEAWEEKAQAALASEIVHYQQMESLSTQAAQLPVNQDTLAAINAVLVRQKEAQRQITRFSDASKNPDPQKRPKYKEVREFADTFASLASKPIGALELERDLKRHEDWMRKGKRLFGKSNAPLHILVQHLEYVQKRNAACFDLGDRFRPPVEPPSRETTPDADSDPVDESPWVNTDAKKKDVFCLCRLQESGLMIECGHCHEWYHGKCLKIARGRVKEVDDYTCPICDWRVKIPRDATRPKLEDLREWQAEIADLPFQPDEEAILNDIIEQATAFRESIHPFTTNPACMTAEEVPTQIFYLRKIEGAEILLAYETNFFRQEIHKYAPVADRPPPILEHSLSTRKPRPTKQQKIMMAQYNAERPEDLPVHLQNDTSSTTSNKRKQSSAQPAHSRTTSIAQSATDDQPPTPSVEPTPTVMSHTSTSTPASVAPVSIPQQSPSTFGYPYSPYPSTSGPFFASLNAPSSYPPPHPRSALDPNLFSPTSFAPNASLHSTSNQFVKETSIPNPDQAPFDEPNSPRGANMDALFADLTNQHDEQEIEPEVSTLGIMNGNSDFPEVSNHTKEQTDLDTTLPPSYLMDHR